MFLEPAQPHRHRRRPIAGGSSVRWRRDPSQTTNRFPQCVWAEEKAGQLDTSALTIYTPANAPQAANLAVLEQRMSVSQYGITWTFATAVPVGQYINGDRYVVGPVTIMMIDPKPRRIHDKRVGTSRFQSSVNVLQLPSHPYASHP